jgi:hypothetical protein
MEEASESSIFSGRLETYEGGKRSKSKPKQKTKRKSKKATKKKSQGKKGAKKGTKKKRVKQGKKTKKSKKQTKKAKKNKKKTKKNKKKNKKKTKKNKKKDKKKKKKEKDSGPGSGMGPISLDFGKGDGKNGKDGDGNGNGDGSPKNDTPTNNAASSEGEAPDAEEATPPDPSDSPAPDAADYAPMPPPASEGACNNQADFLQANCRRDYNIMVYKEKLAKDFYIQNVFKDDPVKTNKVKEDYIDKNKAAIIAYFKGAIITLDDCFKAGQAKVDKCFSDAAAAPATNSAAEGGARVPLRRPKWSTRRRPRAPK